MIDKTSDGNREETQTKSGEKLIDLFIDQVGEVIKDENLAS